MLNNSERLWNIIVLPILLFSITSFSSAQNPAQILHKILSEKAEFKTEDFSILEKGEPVIKFLPTKDKREIAVCGVVRLKNVREVSLKSFQDSLTQRNNKSLIDGGKFSNPPILEDIRSVEFEKNDIEAMKKCEVGKCDLKMSAAMIKRLQTEIDWNSPDYSSSSAQLFRQMLIEYVKNYSMQGNAALLRLDNQKKSISLEEEYQNLLGKLLFINEFTPEFAKYLETFPRSEPKGVENEFYWSKLKFGLKPIITLTHKANYQRQDEFSKQFLIITKQIYASRYVDSSLAITFFLSFPNSETYILFTSLSRSESLDGIFSDFKRDIVELEAKERATELLKLAKYRMEFGVNNEAEINSQSIENGMIKQILNQLQKPVIQIFIFLVLVTIAVILYRRRKISGNGKTK